jgi:hypothetical protein
MKNWLLSEMTLVIYQKNDSEDNYTSEISYEPSGYTE